MSLREPLDDLLAEIPAYVAPDATAAWQAGARRRTRRRLVVTAAALALVVSAGAALQVLPRAGTVQPAGGPRAGSSGYPARIDAPLWLRDLPDDPGRVAGALERADGSWLAVSPTGRLWRLPGAGGRHLVTVSPDGSRLVYLDDRPGQELTVLDLQDGGSSTFSVGADGSTSSAGGYQPWLQSPHTPSFWAPDSRRLLVPVTPAPDNPDRGVAALVWRPGSGATAVRLNASLEGAVPAGWLTRHRLAWVARPPGSGVPSAAARLVVTDTRGRVQRSVALDVPGRAGRIDPTSVSLSADGHVLALGTDQGRAGADIELYFTDDGFHRASMRGIPDAAPHCPAAWAEDDTLLVPASSNDRDAALVARPDVEQQAAAGRPAPAGDPVVLADPRLHAVCSTWAATALTGERHEGIGGTVFGERTSWLSWHWREASGGVAGTALLAALLVGLGRLLRRRRARGVSD